MNVLLVRALHNQNRELVPAIWSWVELAKLEELTVEQADAHNNRLTSEKD